MTSDKGQSVIASRKWHRHQSTQISCIHENVNQRWTKEVESIPTVPLFSILLMSPPPAVSTYCFLCSCGHWIAPQISLRSRRQKFKFMLRHCYHNIAIHWRRRLDPLWEVEKINSPRSIILQDASLLSPATSAIKERIFRIAEEALFKKRWTLSGENAAFLTFLKENVKKL